MEEQDGSNKFNISERLEDVRRQHEALRWEGSFRDYFELVTQNPRIAQLSHARVNDMVHAAGIERLNEGTHHEIISYNFFASELFGIEEPIARLRNYLVAAGMWGKANEEQLLAEITLTIERAAEAYLATAPQSPNTMFDFTYETLPRDLADQRQAALDFVRK